MANQNLTPTMVTREALRILHQKLNFVGKINRQYDERFANAGAQIGDTLQLRLPNQYQVFDGPTLGTQDNIERKIDLVIATQKHVPISFSSKELTLDIDDFGSRILDPAMAVLAATIEADAMNMYQDVYQEHANLGQKAKFDDVLEGKVLLDNSLTPYDNTRCANLNSRDMADVVIDTKGLFQHSTEIGLQYREGMMGRSASFEFYQNTLWPQHTVGAGSGYQVDGAGQTGTSLTVKLGTGALNKGDIITLAGVNKVHHETKADMGVLQQFVVTEAYAGGAGNISISPEIITSGARQTVSASPADSAVITTSTASATHGISMLHHRDAFAFVTADLVMPEGVDFAAREVMDGIAMRIVRQYQIGTDVYPTRIDVLYGYKAIRPELAARLAFN